MEVVLLISAERDLQEAYNSVEEHRQGREHNFLQYVDLRLEHLKKFPLIGWLYRDTAVCSSWVYRQFVISDLHDRLPNRKSVVFVAVHLVSDISVMNRHRILLVERDLGTQLSR